MNERAAPTRREPVRIACGPKRAPGRYDTVVCRQPSTLYRDRESESATPTISSPPTHVKRHSKHSEVEPRVRLLEALRVREPRKACDAGEREVGGTAVLFLCDPLAFL